MAKDFVQHSAEFGFFLFSIWKNILQQSGSGQEDTKSTWLTSVKLLYVLSIPFLASFATVTILSSEFRYYHINYETKSLNEQKEAGTLFR